MNACLPKWAPPLLLPPLNKYFDNPRCIFCWIWQKWHLCVTGTTRSNPWLLIKYNLNLILIASVKIGWGWLCSPHHYLTQSTTTHPSYNHPPTTPNPHHQHPPTATPPPILPHHHHHPPILDQFCDRECTLFHALRHKVYPFGRK